MGDNKKLEFTYCGDIKIEFANVRVIEIGAGSLKFKLDERFPWITVYIGDNSDEGFTAFLTCNIAINSTIVSSGFSFVILCNSSKVQVIVI